MSHWLVIYDVCDKRRLYRVAKLMTNFGIRVQKSVFEMEADIKQIAMIRRKLRRIIEDNDFIVYFEVCERDWQKRIKCGPGKYIETEEKPF